MTDGNHPLDLTLHREIDLPKALVWKAWTTPEILLKWFCPPPWHVEACDIDLQPGGLFRTVFVGPDGQKMENLGCYLSVKNEQELIFTDALGPNFRPTGASFSTVSLRLSEQHGKTHYDVRVLHKNAEDRKQHQEMGFDVGWNQCLDQLIAVMTAVK